MFSFSSPVYLSTDRLKKALSSLEALNQSKKDSVPISAPAPASVPNPPNTPPTNKDEFQRKLNRLNEEADKLNANIGTKNDEIEKSLTELENDYNIKYNYAKANLTKKSFNTNSYDLFFSDLQKEFIVESHKIKKAFEDLYNQDGIDNTFSKKAKQIKIELNKPILPDNIKQLFADLENTLQQLKQKNSELDVLYTRFQEKLKSKDDPVAATAGPITNKDAIIALFSSFGKDTEFVITGAAGKDINYKAIYLKLAEINPKLTYTQISTILNENNKDAAPKTIFNVMKDAAHGKGIPDDKFISVNDFITKLHQNKQKIEVKKSSSGKPPDASQELSKEEYTKLIDDLVAQKRNFIKQFNDALDKTNTILEKYKENQKIYKDNKSFYTNIYDLNALEIATNIIPHLNSFISLNNITDETIVLRMQRETHKNKDLATSIFEFNRLVTKLKVKELERTPLIHNIINRDIGLLKDYIRNMNTNLSKTDFISLNKKIDILDEKSKFEDKKETNYDGTQKEDLENLFKNLETKTNESLITKTKGGPFIIKNIDYEKIYKEIKKIKEDITYKQLKNLINEIFDAFQNKLKTEKIISPNQEDLFKNIIDARTISGGSYSKQKTRKSNSFHRRMTRKSRR